MRTFEEQRREFVLLAMRLIEQEKDDWYMCTLKIQNGIAQFKYGLIAISCSHTNGYQINENAIQHLKDLLEETK